MSHQTTDERLFQHDSTCCTFLGSYDGHDLYWCAQGGAFPTVMARYGNEGSEYKSGMIFADRGLNPHLVEAKRRAQERGLKVTDGH